MEAVWVGISIALAVSILVVVLIAALKAGKAEVLPVKASIPPGHYERESELPRLPSLAYRDSDFDEIEEGVTRTPEERIENAKNFRGACAHEQEEKTGLHQLILVSSAVQSDVGKRRSNNEDSYLILAQENLFVVADGMGGTAAGEVASRIAVQTMEESFREKNFPGLEGVKKMRRAHELVSAIELANEGVLRAANENPEMRGMGTTVVALRFSANKRRVYVASVGDSRAYRIREGQISLLTKDHNLAMEAGVPGALGEQLTRAVGLTTTVEPDVLIEEALPDDYYLICSDGLTKMVKDEEIRDCVLNTDIEQVAKKLVDLANERGGIDNVTTIVTHIDHRILN
jgi:PPM family protein phosphatase